MNISIEWDNEEHTILRYDVHGPWTWDEFYTARQMASDLMDESPNDLVDAIIDFRSGNFMPRNALSHFQQVARTSNSKAGIAVMVGTTGFIKTLYYLMSRLYSSMEDKMRIAETLEEARALLAKRQSESSMPIP